jgi:hypothetical protein
MRLEMDGYAIRCLVRKDLFSSSLIMEYQPDFKINGSAFGANASQFLRKLMDQ